MRVHGRFVHEPAQGCVVACRPPSASHLFECANDPSLRREQPVSVQYPALPRDGYWRPTNTFVSLPVFPPFGVFPSHAPEPFFQGVRPFRERDQVQHLSKLNPFPVFGFADSPG
uniref:Uncharacterized protein n=1 Tax=Schistocephalus solidus TaxID=70667 RepID=A0A0X3P2T3_SCHSO